MSKLRDWFNRTPTADSPTKEELRKANARRIQLTGGGSYVERPPRTDRPQLPNMPNYIPFDWNREIKEENPILNLIDKLQDEVRRAAGDDFYDNIYCAMEVRDILNEIQQAIYDMEV